MKNVEIVFDTCYKIPRQINPTIYSAIRDSLTTENKGFGSTPIGDDIEENQIKYFIETENYLYVPRFYPLKDFVGVSNIPANENIPKPISVSFVGELRNKMQFHAVDYLIDNPECILQLGPGSGKTVIAIAAMCKLGLKTLILTHRSALVEQWIDRLLQFTNASKDDIGVLKSSKYKEIIETKSIILATPQTIVSIIKKALPEFEIVMKNSGIGLFIADEVHTAVGAPEFSKASLMVPAKRVIGLSATPQRKVGYGYLLQHLGEVYNCDQFATDTMSPKVFVCLFDFEINISKRYRYLNWGNVFQYARYYNLYNKSKPFYKVSKDILDLCIQRDRNIVMMLERIKDIDVFMDHYSTQDVAKFTGGVGNSVLTKKIVFTTPGKMRDGVDAPWKDAMILTSNISNIIQAAGRIVRTHPGKDQPIIFDFVDYKTKQMRFPFWKNRYNYYIEKGWDVLFFHYDKDMVRKSINEIQARSLD